jgi:hypothetical protein
MEEIQVFRRIRTPYKKSLIYTRLGYSKTSTIIEPANRKQIEQWIAEAERLCEVTVLYKKLPVLYIDEDIIRLFGGIEFSSKSLASLLKNSTAAVLMAATSGNKITDEIGQLQRAGKMAKALVYDAAASEITDAGLDWLMAFINRALISRGQQLTHMRFSPGYKDLELHNQEIFLAELELKKYGIRVNEKYILIPEKTVTAVAGIETPDGAGIS